MTLHSQTIEYAFPTNETALAATTRFDFAAITLYVPEVTSRTFRSVHVEITTRDDNPSAQSMTAWLVGIKLGVVAFSDATVTSTLSHSAKHQTYVLTRNVTSYFAANFGSGASQTCQVGVLFTAAATMNTTAKLVVTYEYDDAAQTTLVKTVRIPLESPVGAITTSLAELGANQVPNLDSFLPEASKVYRNIFFEVFGNSANSDTVDAQLGFALDAEAEDLTGNLENALNSANWHQFLWVRNDLVTSAAHAFKLRTTQSGTPFNMIGVVLVVTYEYDSAASTRIVNGLVLPFSLPDAMGYTTATDRDVVEIPVWVEEPGTITLVQSAVKFFFTVGAAVSGVNVSAGAQSDRAYTHANGTTSCGQYSLVQRIDSGGAQGAGVTLARGLNTITVRIHHTDATDRPGGVCGCVYLNYTSDKHASGAGVHSHTTIWSLGDTAAPTYNREFAAAAPNIPESSYYATHIGVLSQMVDSIGAIISTSHGLKAERLSGEGPGDGWERIAATITMRNYRPVQAWLYDDASRYFDREPLDPDTRRLAVEGSRKYRFYSPIYTGESSFTATNLLMYLTYHAITFAISGTITGSAGGTVNIAAHRTDTGERIATTSRSGDGAYSMTWYDDTIAVYTDARESGTKLGRSDDFAAA